MIRILGAPWRLTKWFGRVTLWIVFWPFGLWRSIANSQRKTARRHR